jgi:adenosylhomocysteine nucleosidase
MKGNILIVAALSGELKPLVKHGSAKSWRRVKSSPGTEVWEYRHPDGCWLAACAGMGGDRAALAFAEAAKFAAIDIVCSIGWAGALKSEVPVSTVWSPSLIVDTRTGERFRPSYWLPKWPALATSSHVADAEEKRRLVATYGVSLVDMEASTVARIAQGQSIPFYCFKAVSDGANADLPGLNPFIGYDGQIRMLPFLLHVALRPVLWAGLIRLAKHSTAAAKNLAESVYNWIDGDSTARQATGDYTNPNKG